MRFKSRNFLNKYNRMKTRNIHIRNISDANAFSVEIYNFNGAHQFVDSTNASVEIGRRGLFKFESGSFYPEMTERDADTLEAVLAVGNDGSNGRDALHKIVSRSFIDAYKSGRSLFSRKDFEHRYRIRIE